MSASPLTPRQLAVLQWVADGCPAGVWPDETHKHSARALEARGLVAVRRQNGIWHAVMRPDGQHYLDHGDYPSRTATAGTPRPTVPRSRKPQMQRPATPGVANETHDPLGALHIELPPARSPSAAESLIAQIQEAGGTLTFDLATDQERARLDAQIRAVRRFGKLPPGLQLISAHPSWRKRILTLAPLPVWMTAAPVPVPVAAQLHNPHPAVAMLRDNGRLPVTGPPRIRRAHKTPHPPWSRCLLPGERTGRDRLPASPPHHPHLRLTVQDPAGRHRRSPGHDHRPRKLITRALRVHTSGKHLQKGR